jgi:predicted nucleotidyltransferase
MKSIQHTIFATSEQKIISFLADNSGKEFTEKEISKASKVKKSAVNLALHRLSANRLISKKTIGRSSLFKIEENNLFAKEIKILQSILTLSDLLEKLKPFSQRIILFGSSAEGRNTKESDIDLFVQTDSPEKVRKVILSSPLREKVQLIAKKPKEILKINKKKPLLFQEIDRGRVLWENYGE